MNYELVAGLETHIELSTKSKLFCSCSVEFGAEPNTHCCPVCMGHPGTLPVINRQAVYFAVMAGLALNCRILSVSRMDRKNYSYPDLPKAYQITQLHHPICADGYLELSTGKRIRINRIQLEEDAGKLVHKDNEVYIDYNRCGVPLIEIVSEPDFATPQEAREYIEKLRILMRYIGVSDCRMQEGSMRFDVNVSAKEKGSPTLGTRTEIKNMNSVSNMVKAMEYEYSRQCDVLRGGGSVTRETLRYDEAKAVTVPMRSKEDAKDYRFFAEPDLLPIALSEEEICSIRNTMPVLPEEKCRRYMEDYALSYTDAEQLSKYRRVSRFFDKVAENVKNPSLAANLIISRVFSFFETENDKEDFNILTSSEDFAELVRLAESGTISKNLAKTTLDKMLSTGKSLRNFISAQDTKKLTPDQVSEMCRKAINENPCAVADYKNGKDKAIMAILGAVMRYSKGKADPEAVRNQLTELLS